MPETVRKIQKVRQKGQRLGNLHQKQRQNRQQNLKKIQTRGQPLTLLRVLLPTVQLTAQTAQQGASNQSVQSARSPQQSQGNGISAGTAASADDSISGNTETQTSNYLSQAFVNYLNQQRSAAGLNQITWNSGLESLALTFDTTAEVFA